jgi:hypothetical protein
MDKNFDHQMSLSKSKCLYSYSCLCFLKRAVPLGRKMFYETGPLKYLIEDKHQSILA